MMINENESAAEGPVIDHEPQPEKAKAAMARPQLKIFTAFAAAIVVVLAIALLGAWIYSASGLQFLGGATADRLAALETRLSQMEQRAGEQAAQAQALADRLDGLNAQVEGRSGDGARIAALEAKLAALAKGVEALQAQPVSGDGSQPAPPAIKQLQEEIETLKKQLAANPAPAPSLAPEREALAAELGKIAEDLKPAVPATQQVETGTWSGWAMAQLSRYYTVRPAGSALADDFAKLARAQDIAGAVRLIRAQTPPPPALADWLVRAEAFLAKAEAP